MYTDKKLEDFKSIVEFSDDEQDSLLILSIANGLIEEYGITNNYEALSSVTAILDIYKKKNKKTLKF